MPCSGNSQRLNAASIDSLLADVENWELVYNGARIRRSWRVKDFPTALDFFCRIGTIAESEDHHPDIHLTNYRDVVIELWTHAADGLTENDFIMAAKINEIPIELKP